MAMHVASLQSTSSAASHVATHASAARQVLDNNKTRATTSVCRMRSADVSSSRSSGCRRRALSSSTSSSSSSSSSSQFFGGNRVSLAAAGLKENRCSNKKAPRGQLHVRALGEFLSDGNVRHFYDAETLQKYLDEAGNKLVVLDISAKICGPCKLIYPKIVKMSEEYADAVFLKIEGDHDTTTRALMKEWGIKSVPCFRFFRNGEMIHTHTGAREEVLKEHFFKYYQPTAENVKTG